MFLSRILRFALIFSLATLFSSRAFPQNPTPYQPTIESLDRHPLPAWYDDAKLGIFIHWGLYSVPGWAPLVHPNHDFSSQDYIINNPYAEWYYNTMRIDGSPTQKYHRDTYGADYDYYNFAPIFNAEIKKWNPDTWAEVFRAAGAKYVVLTSKHHEGFTLWPSKTPNPTLPPDRQHASRDIVGELTVAVRKQGLRMGLYYSGGYDWTFVPGPIRVAADYQTVQPHTEAYGKYADAHVRELIELYKPSLLWNDINYPKSGHPLELMALYYNTVPDGVIDDRFGVKHHDFTSPEYQTLTKINPNKWEECRGLGRSFGYNRTEGEAETIPSADLIYLLVDIVSKNGNLLLDVGPEADGTIPAVQMERLRDLGDWLRINGDAIYATHPWQRAEGITAEGIPVRFTQKNSTLYAILLGVPKSSTIILKSISPKSGSHLYLLGHNEPLAWSQQAGDIKITIPPSLTNKFAVAFCITEPQQ
ncbi:MAG TPA: alpha-L-fucosidase [Candidatus Acidoferrum sp.]|jgi:alpha-L-fucosidase